MDLASFIPQKVLLVLEQEERIGRGGLADKADIPERLAEKYITLYRTLKDVDLTSSPLELVRQQARETIKKAIKRPCRLGHLSQLTHLSINEVEEMIEQIQHETGLPVNVENGHVTINKYMAQSINPINLAGTVQRLKIGIVSDTHMCSKQQQLTLLKSAYQEMENEGIDFCLHAGDLVDGAPTMHVGMLHELFLHTFEEQVDYVVAQYPRTDHFKTYVRPGNHDHSWIKANAGDPVRVVCKQREDDLVYVGPEESAFSDDWGNILVELFHPAGGMPYSRSYRGQKLYESAMSTALAEYQVSEKVSLPHILAIGHLHQFDYFIQGYSHIMLVPCFQSQTPYLRSKGLTPMVGYIILEISIDERGHILEAIPRVKNLSSRIIQNDY